MDIIVQIVVGLILLVMLSMVLQLQNDIVRIRQKLDCIVKHMGIGEQERLNIDSELKGLILEGKKIEAIKRYRIVNGTGLKEAKEYIDKLSET